MGAAEFSPAVVSVIWDRCYAACERCGRGLRRSGRGRQWSVHHRQPRGAGGSSDEALGLASNGAALCGSGTTGCHGWVESHRVEAVLSGFIVPAGESPADVPVSTFTFGRVLFTDAGGVARA